MPRLTRHLPRLIASLCLGLLTAAAVAYYGERIFLTTPTRATAPDQPGVGWTSLTRNRSVFTTSRSAHIESAMFPSFSDARAIRSRFLSANWSPAPPATDPWGGPADLYVSMFEHGWPVRFTWGVLVHGRAMPSPMNVGIARIPDGPLAARLFPVIPSISGAIVDTVFWGLPWWLLFWAVYRLRLHLRARAGRCRRCRYDLAGLPAGCPCPECGLPSSSAEARATPAHTLTP